MGQGVRGGGVGKGSGGSVRAGNGDSAFIKATCGTYLEYCTITTLCKNRTFVVKSDFKSAVSCVYQFGNCPNKLTVTLVVTVTTVKCQHLIFYASVLDPWQNKDIVATTLCSVMLPVRGKTWQQIGARIEVFPKIFRNIFCLPQMWHTWQNESTFGKHDHVTNVAATMCPCFSSPLLK